MALAFHYGNFSTSRDTYGDGSILNAAQNGRIYANTPPAYLPPWFGSFTVTTNTITQTTYTWTLNESSLVDVLVVAGGGGGGTGSSGSGDAIGGGGGGAGGLIYTTSANVVRNVSINVKVGAGGAGSVVSTELRGEKGQDSTFGTLTAVGGGGGGKRNGEEQGGSGGSGGGGSTGVGGSGTDGQGFTGGGGLGVGGGGGAGAPGESSSSASGKGNGGKGLEFNQFIIYGDDGYFSGGGGSGIGNFAWTNSRGDGGKGGGGNGSDGGEIINDGLPHTGGGGGGGPSSSLRVINGGNGGSGIVIVSLLEYMMSYPIMRSYPIASDDAKIYLDANDFSAQSSDTRISYWGGYTAVNAGSGLPLLKTDEAFRYVRFGDIYTSNTRGNYINLGTQTWNLQNGFTAVGVIRFWAVKTWQRWFDFGNGPNVLNILWTKVGDANLTSLWAIRDNDNNIINNESTNTVPVGGGWYIVIARARSSTLVEHWANPNASLEPIYFSTNISGSPLANFTERTLTNNWIGRSNWSNDPYSCIDIRETSFFDYALPDYQLESLVTHLRAKYGFDPQLHQSGPISISDTRNIVLGSGGSKMRSLNNFREHDISSLSSINSIPNTGPIKMSNLYGLGYIGYPSSIPNLYAHYVPESWSAMNERWEDISGNNRHTVLTKGSIVVGTSIDSDGVSVQCLIGDTTEGLQFPEDVLPITFTLFHLTRYRGPTRGRIIDGLENNWLDGFHGNKSGVAFRGNAWLTQDSTSVFGDNWVISCSQNRIYRANGIQQNTSLPTTGGTTQLTINYGVYASTEPSDWACAEVIVYDRILTIDEINRVERYIRNKYRIEPSYGLNALSNSARQSLVAAYSFKRCLPTYTGPTVRVRRGNDNAVTDFYATISGVLHADSRNSGVSLSNWLNGQNGFIEKWYDQSGRSNHVVQTVPASQPKILISQEGVCMYLDGMTTHLAGPNVFDSNTISDMHWVIASKELSRNHNGSLVSLNGENNSSSNRFVLYAPYGVDGSSAYVSPLPVYPDIILDANEFSEAIHGSTISEWGGYNAVSVGGSALPIVRTDEPYRYVRLGSATASTSTNGNYINLGSRTWNLQNGFTAVGVIRFYARKNWQRWFDFGNQAANLNIVWANKQTGSDAVWDVYNNTSSAIALTVSNVVPLNQWIVVIARIPSSVDSAETWVNLSTALLPLPKYSTSGSVTQGLTRTLSNNWIGRSNWSNDSYACLDIRENHFYNRALTDKELQDTITYLHRKYNSLWFADYGNTTSDRSVSDCPITSVGTNVIFSGYKKSSGNNSGFRVNSGTRYLSSSNSSANVENGIRFRGDGSLNHYVFSTFIFNSKLPDADERIVEGYASRRIRDTTRYITRQPRFTSFNTVADDYSTNYGWDTNSGWSIETSVPGVHDSSGWGLFKGGGAWRSGEITFHGGFGNVWIRLNYPYPVKVVGWEIYGSSNSNDRKRGIKTAVIEASNSKDETAWTQVGPLYELEYAEAYVTYRFDVPETPQSYRYWRIRITQVHNTQTELNADYAYLQVHPYNLNFYSILGNNTPPRNPLILRQPQFTSSNTVIGDFSSNHGGWDTDSGWSIETSVAGGHESDRVSNNNWGLFTGNGAWLSGAGTYGAWLSGEGTFNSGNGNVWVRLNYPYPVKVVRWEIWGSLDGNNRLRGIKTAVIEASNIDSNEQTAWTQIGSTYENVEPGFVSNRFFDVPETPLSYRYWRIRITKIVSTSTSGSWTQVHIIRLNFYSIKPAGALDHLDVYDGIVGAYSLRRLFHQYTGPQISVARTDNNALSADIYYDKDGANPHLLNGNSLTTFASGSTLRILKWYDQSGKGNDGVGIFSPLLNTLDISKHSINLNPYRYISIPSTNTNDLIINGSTTPFWAYMAFHGDGLVFPNTLLSRTNVDNSGSSATDYRFWTDGINQWTFGTGSVVNTNAWMSTGISGGASSPCVMAGSHLPNTDTKGFYLRNSTNSTTSTAFRNTSGKYTSSSETRPVYIGSLEYGFKGRVYEVLIYRRDMTGILNDSIIDNLSNRYLPTIIAFKFGNDDGSGGVFADLTPLEIATRYPPERFGTITVVNNGSDQSEYEWIPITTVLTYVLVVAGGGGGGGVIGGGGGAGGLIFNANTNLGNSTTIIVGRGGTGGTGWNTSSQNGKLGFNSQFANIIANGGGGGRHHGGITFSTDVNGGSGGGGAKGGGNGGTGITGQGNNGGNGGDDNFGAGGGGSAEVGGNVTANYGGRGGQGLLFSSVYRSGFGDDGYFAGGGGGGVRSGNNRIAGLGGLGGGGNATANSSRANDGMPHTGGGGGGGGYNVESNSQIGGNGGSGIVLVHL